MDVILWYSENKAPNSQENWDRIKSWWHELDGKNLELRYVMGTQVNANGKEEILRTMSTYPTIQNPSLEDNRLKCVCDNVPWDKLVEKLELDINQNELKVYSSDSKQYIFIHKSGQGSRRIQSFSVR